MRFEMMMNFWQMKNMVHQDACLTRDSIYNSTDQNVVYMMELRDLPRNGTYHANVIYRYTVNHNGIKSRFALVHADISYTGFAGGPSQISIKNAKAADLRRVFIEDL